MAELEAVREALPLSGDSSCVPMREGTEHCSACGDKLPQLLPWQQSTFHCTGSRGTEGKGPSQPTQ